MLKNTHEGTLLCFMKLSLWVGVWGGKTEHAKIVPPTAPLSLSPSLS